MKAGDVITIPYFPNQENKEEGTARWAILVEDYEDSFGVVPLTSQLQQKDNYNKVLQISKFSSEGIQMGLIYDSLIICDRETEIHKIVLKGKGIEIKGNCPDELIDAIINLIHT